MYRLGAHVVYLGKLEFQPLLIDDMYIYGTINGQTAKVLSWSTDNYEYCKLPEESKKVILPKGIMPGHVKQVIDVIFSEQLNTKQTLEDSQITARTKGSNARPVTVKIAIDSFDRAAKDIDLNTQVASFMVKMMKLMVATVNESLGEDWRKLAPEVSNDVVRISTFNGGKKELTQVLQDIGLHDVQVTNLNYALFKRGQRRNMPGLLSVVDALEAMQSQPS